MSPYDATRPQLGEAKSKYTCILTGLKLKQKWPQKVLLDYGLICYMLNRLQHLQIKKLRNDAVIRTDYNILRAHRLISYCCWIPCPITGKKHPGELNPTANTMLKKQSGRADEVINSRLQPSPILLAALWYYVYLFIYIVCVYLGM